MATFDVLDGHKFMSLKTFRKSGEPKPTPVWFAREGDKLYVVTQAQSWKVKRIRNNADVEVAPSDARGNLVGEDYVMATAKIWVDGTPEAKTAMKTLLQKYKLALRVFQLLGMIRGSEYVFLEVTPR